MGGTPSKGTPADKRLKGNKPAPPPAKKPAPGLKIGLPSLKKK